MTTACQIIREHVKFFLESITSTSLFFANQADKPRSKQLSPLQGLRTVQTAR